MQTTTIEADIPSCDNWIQKNRCQRFSGCMWVIFEKGFTFRLRGGIRKFVRNRFLFLNSRR